MALFLDTHVWYAISFFAFAFIVYKFGKPAILKYLDDQIQAVREELKTAEGLRIEAQDLLAQYQRKHRDAVEEAQIIIKNAQNHAEEITRKAEADLDEAMARREKQLQERLTRMKEAAIGEIQTYTANLAIEATAEIIAEKLDKKTNETLVESSISNIGQKLH